MWPEFTNEYKGTFWVFWVMHAILFYAQMLQTNLREWYCNTSIDVLQPPFLSPGGSVHMFQNHTYKHPSIFFLSYLRACSIFIRCSSASFSFTFLWWSSSSAPSSRTRLLTLSKEKLIGSATIKEVSSWICHSLRLSINDPMHWILLEIKCCLY